MPEPLLKIRGLKKYFDTPFGPLHAVDNINLDIYKGQTLGIVGESGCGKSTLGRVLVRLLESTDGEVLYKGKDVLKYNKNELKTMRKNMQIIFQDPYSSLNPRKSIGDIISEPIFVNKILKGRVNIENKVKELMDIVGLPERQINSYPHELDGGRRQRVGVARALSVNPEFIVCDEPVSALDVSIQAQILNLLMDLQEEFDLTYMFITHDLSVVKHISNEIAVMYLGECIEKTSSDELYDNPLHPYTKALLSAIPVPDINIMKNKSRHIIKGEVTSPINPGIGCRFAPRCRYAKEICINKKVELKEINENHYVACTLYY
ncbi:MAG: ATP-binding cassette domain-containing protein [Bacillota bacterium]|nr:ATP-binding cassette domain-containing protein [Bacillota bacterium]